MPDRAYLSLTGDPTKIAELHRTAIDAGVDVISTPLLDELTVDAEDSGYPTELRQTWTDPTGEGRWKIVLTVECDSPLPPGFYQHKIATAIDRCSSLADALPALFRITDDGGSPE
jgi:hypothetical protein